MFTLATLPEREWMYNPAAGSGGDESSGNGENSEELR